MMTNIYFVRHAHSTYTPDELGRPLSEKGLTDAKKVTKSLRNESIDLVMSSPYKRAMQTVEGIAEYINKKIIMEENFKERKLAGQPVDNFQEAIEKVWRDPAFAWTGGESNNVAQQRGVEAINRILKEYEGKNVAIGIHGNIMVLIMNYFDKRFNYNFWKELKMPDIYKLSFEGNDFVNVQRMELAQ
ncbi:histidine phosphatase family protein [Virgibacillus doumboii]|uniref:histidine phosphatase family protein n=1 Tax=Virgibacillus doumboii TaxID=2697503 RepID=UPI001FE46CB0|nr:histidine phosphatase family protein [Virgibacillus doumboii]